MVKTHDTKYFTQNLDFSCNDNGIHSVILWLKAVVALLLIEGLHCGRVLYQGNYNVAVICSWLLLYQNLITIEIPALIMLSPFTFSMKLCSLGINSAGMGK